MQKKNFSHQSLSRKKNKSSSFSRALRTRRTLVELLEPRQLLTASTPVLVPGPFTHGSNPTRLLTIGNVTYFAATDEVHGGELWKTDGTAAGTMLVKDINPGSDDGLYSYNLPEFVNVNGTLFFTANDGIHGYELWKSDGTAAGTVMVADLNGGTPSSIGSYPSQFTNFNGELFFTANDGDGVDVWKSDGTESGTTRLIDNSYGTNLRVVSGKLYFSVGTSLYKSDGTVAGTAVVANIPATLSIGDLTDFNGTLFFTGNDPTQGLDLWKSDGTVAGTVLVKDIGQYDYINEFTRTQLVVVDNVIFFAVNDGIHGSELWKSDGTEAGTVMVKDIDPEPTTDYRSNPPYLTNINGMLYFSASDGPDGRELWKSDGTEAGTVMVKDINPNTGFYHDDLARGDSYPTNLFNFNGVLYFAATDGANGNELWKSDGTEAGTVMVRDIFPGASYNNLSYYVSGLFGNSSAPANFAVANGTLLFSASDSTHGNELWSTDGTAAGTSLVTDINTNDSIARAHYLTNVDGTLYFIAPDPRTISDFNYHGFEALWKTDATLHNTELLRVFPEEINQLTNVNGTLFFVARKNGSPDLWKTDGTPEGTVLVKDIRPRNDINESYARTKSLTNVDGMLFFSYYDDASNGNQLWKSDGTEAGTILLANIGSYTPFHPNPTTADLVDFNGTLYLFEQYANSTRSSLWKSDGAAAGTTLVKEFPPTFGDIATLANFEGKLYFSIFALMNDPYYSYYRELWKSDGTENGTVIVEQFAYGDSNAEMLNINDNLIFIAPDPQYGSLLYYLSPSLTPGDFNGDGHVNSSDIGPAMQALANPSDYETQYNVAPPYLSTIGDVNGDGQFTNADLQRLLYLLRTGGGSISTEQSTTDSTSSNSNTASQPTDTQLPIISEIPFIITSNDQAIEPPATNLDDQPAPPINDAQTTASASLPYAPKNDQTAIVAPPTESPPIATLSESDAIPTSAVAVFITTSSWSDPAAPASSYESPIVERSSHHVLLAAIDQAFLGPSDLRTRRQRWHAEQAKITADPSENPSLPLLLANWSQS